MNPTLVIRIAGLIEGHRWARGFAGPEALDQVSRIESIAGPCAELEDGLRPGKRFALRIAGRESGGTEVRAF